MLFFGHFGAVTFEQIPAIPSERITPHVNTKAGPPKVTPPGPWSDPSKVQSVIKTYDGPNLKATSGTMG